MQTQDQTEEPRAGDERRRRWLVAIGVFAVAIVGATVLVLSTSDVPTEDAAAVAGTTPDAATTTPNVATTAAPSSSGGPLGGALVGLDGSFSSLGLPADAWTADLSPDGRSVAFVTASTEVGPCDGCSEEAARVAIVPVGGTVGEYVDLAVDGLSSFGHLAWSPDGMRLAFQAEAEDGNVDLYVADLAAGAPYVRVPVTRLTTDPAVDEFPAWSADGSAIFYDNLGSQPAESGLSVTGEIWRVTAGGGDPVRLTDNDTADTQPDVGPDGTVAFWRHGLVWTMAPDGTEQRRLEGFPGDGWWNPRWSPDGTKLVVLRYDPSAPQAMFPVNPIHGTMYPTLDVVVVDVATGAVTELGAQVASFYNPPSWAPDGATLLVVRHR